jgi:hypothetical protein
MADKRITELTNEKLILGDGDYTIVDSNEGTYKYKLKRIVDSIPAPDTTLSIAGRAADAAKTGQEIADVKRDYKGYIYGVDAEFTVASSGTHIFHVPIIKGVRYSFTNKTSAGCTLGYKKPDGTSEIITGAVNQNKTIYFTPTSDVYVNLVGYFNGTGTVEITNDLSSLAKFSDTDNAINNGILPLGKLIPNIYIAPTGAESNYNGWSATDFIPVGLAPILRITSPSGNGGNYDVFYDSSKQFVSNFYLPSGTKEIEVPDTAVYFRLSNSTSALEGTVVENIIGYLNRKVIELEPQPASTPTITEWNVDESMVANAGANYGFHSGGQSNVQKRFSMLVTTDPHGDAIALERAVDYLNEMPCFDCGACLGDLQANTFSDNDGTWYTNVIKEADVDFFTIIGNHDVGIGKSIASTGNQTQVYNKFIAPNLQYAGVTPDGVSYYYKDYSSYKIRVICLNCYDVDNNDTSGSEYVVPRYKEYYSQDQIDWLVNLLANTPSDYHVMVLVHNTPKASVKDTSVNFNNKTYSFSPESSQQGIVADIIDAWQRGTTLSQTYPCTDSNLDDVTVSADFTSRGAGEFICFLTGHMHVDCIGHITSFPNLNVFTLASTNTGTYQNDWSDLPRADGTKAEDCITALSVDTTNKKIYINRIGSSVSRWFTVREPSVISYN